MAIRLVTHDDMVASSATSTSKGVGAWRAYIPLSIIVVVQGLYSFFAMRNTAFQDEALYLFAGRQILNSWHGGPPVVEPYGTYFSGYPSFYPVIAAQMDYWGGVEGARFFSSICIAIVTVCMFFITRRLFSEQAAIFATILFAFQGSTLFIGRLATYDAFCLMLLALATVLAVYTSQSRTPWLVLLISPLLVLAVLAKYAGLLFIPSILLLLLWQTWKFQGLRAVIVHGIMVVVSLIGSVVAILLSGNREALVGLSFTTTNRVAFLKTPTSILASHIIVYGGIIIACAIAGAIVIPRRYRFLALVLLGTALLAPAYHLYKGEIISLNKHIAFSAFFAAPLAGYALLQLIGSPKLAFSSRWLASFAICLVVFIIGTQQSVQQFHDWGTSNQLMSVLRSQVRPNIGHLLTEEFEVCRYYLQDVSKPWQWTGLNWFEYKTASGQTLTGNQAYVTAVKDGYFDVIELSFGFNYQQASQIRDAILKSHNYEQIAQLPYTNSSGSGFYYVYRHITP